MTLRYWLVEQDLASCLQQSSHGAGSVRAVLSRNPKATKKKSKKRNNEVPMDLVSSVTHAGIIELRKDLWDIEV